MKQKKLKIALVAALYAIRHNGIDYEKDDLLEVPNTQVIFLRMAKCVRKPTAAEIEDWEAQKQAEQQAATSYVNEEELSPFIHDTSSAKDVAGEAQTDANLETHVVVDDTNTDSDDAVVENVVTGESVNAPEATAEPDIDTVSETHSDETGNPYDGWLKKDLNAELDKRGIEHDDKARNDELEQLLLDDDAKQA